MLPRWLHHEVEARLEHFLRPIGSEEEDFLEPRGEPALLPPDSVSWKIFKNPLGLYIGGVAAVVLQLAEPRVGSGVWQYTTFRQHPLERLQRTGHAAMMTVYGPRSRTEQMIAGVTRLHARVRGTAPDGEPSARAIPSFSSGCMRPPASDLSRRITPTYGRSHWSSAIGSSRRVCRRQSSTAPAPYRNRSQHSKLCSLE